MVSKSDQTQSSLMQGGNTVYLESLYKRYLTDKSGLEPEWQDFFAHMDDERRSPEFEPSWVRNDWPPEIESSFFGSDEKAQQIKEQFKSLTVSELTSEKSIKRAVIDSVRALMLIRAYRILGHLVADLDPLGMRDHPTHPELDPQTYGFQEADLDRPIFIDNVLGLEIATIKEILDIVKRTYCGTFALQYMHISNPEEASWLKERIEGLGKEIEFSRRGRKAILNKLIEAEGFEKFLHVKYMGTKRFGLDGGESLIPAMEQIIKRGGARGVQDILIGMPHRGRLSVLANVMAKPYRAIFNEFQGGSSKPEDVDGSGDVKYHLGASSDREFDGNSVHLSLAANPSHLEAVNPVVLGKARAKQDQLDDDERVKVLPVLIHGDAAFAGQGVVAEGFGLSGLKGHKTGGTIHIVVNNQIGFTTAPHLSRSSPYPTDIALMVEAPIFHVNGDDPEAVVHAAKVATEFRQKFHKDVVLDIICYRRFGHNEGDEPMFTNPLMYNQIKKQKTTLTIYSDRLVSDGLISSTEVQNAKADFQAKLNEEFEAGKVYKPNKADWLDGKWSHLKRDNEVYQRGGTSLSKKAFSEVSRALTNVPDGFELHKTVLRLLAEKKKMFASGNSIDWSTAEALAFGSLLIEGYPVRLSGQDSTRGTFSQRHSALVDQKTEERYFPLNYVRNGQANFEVIDSMLSEYAVLGFEYGYSLAEPNSLVLWEAQFGDFANGAQIMFDQFISSGEAKWLRMSGLVMLLPHGFEGQGPEHSSARLERFLQMCGGENWIVANCSTPANYFHILRRQMHRSFRKPLVLMTPKSLLRNKSAVSKATDFLKGSSFHRILHDHAENESSHLKLKPDNQIKRLILCSGKIYYDLYDVREENGVDDVYILRFEQFYPFPSSAAIKELKRFKHAEVFWCQEEPKNQGAWNFMEPNIEWVLNHIKAKNKRAIYVGRPASASPATGSATQHKSQQDGLIEEALRLGEKKMTQVRVPTLGESVTEATVATWFKKVGDLVAVDEMLCELETDKVTVEVPSPISGILKEIISLEGSAVGIDALLAEIKESDLKVTETKEFDVKKNGHINQELAESHTIKEDNDGHAPSARKLMAENNLSSGEVLGTGRDGRIMKEDVKNTLKNVVSRETQVLSSMEGSNELVSGPEERVKMTRLRKTIAERLKESQNTAAMLTTYNEVDMTEILGLRNKYKQSFEIKHGVKLGFMSFFTKACCHALFEIPEVNSEIQNEYIVYKKYVNMGIATGTPSGLVVPVIKNAQSLSFAELEKAIADKGDKAREGKLSMDDMMGGSFTISNGGVYGSLMSSPILNPPQSGILGMHKIQDRPIVRNEKIEIRPMMYLALSYDHRIVDGKGAVTFLVRVKEALEDPRRLLIDL